MFNIYMQGCFCTFLNCAFQIPLKSKNEKIDIYFNLMSVILIIDSYDVLNTLVSIEIGEKIENC